MFGPDRIVLVLAPALALLEDFLQKPSKAHTSIFFLHHQ